ncbi:MAG: T9SS type A sorting domain-containing protein, partial [Flavobacterium sp.]|nr:T9SS type A sorting domain-containing protein [Flavobacterium sp.]
LEEVVPGEDEEDEEIILYSQSVDRTSNYFTLNMFTGLQLGTTYRLRVALGFNGVFGPYGSGKDCSVTYVTAEDKAPLLRTVVDEETGLMDSFAAVAYPNPFAASFNLDIKASATSPVSIVVYDMMGRLLESSTITVAQANSTNIGGNYPTGVYNVVVTQGEEVKMIRVVKQ